ncbi:MAG: glycogen-binding domain-containing protein [bacterium]
MMSKKALYIILILDLLLFAGAMYVVILQLSEKNSLSFITPKFLMKSENTKSDSLLAKYKESKTQQMNRSTNGIPDQNNTVKKNQALPKSNNEKTRRILFTYRNSKPSKVSIAGEFNDWKPAPLIKGANHTWSLSLPLKPGNYLYGYFADGNFIPDPNNPNVEETPNGKKCSFITIKPFKEGE